MADIDTGFYTQSNPNALLGTAQAAVGVRNAQAQNALLGIDINQQHQNLVQSQVGYLTNGFSALASKPDLSPQDFITFGQRALQEGIISPDVYQAELANVNAAGNDPDKLRGLANGYLMRAQSAGDQFAAARGYAPAAGGTPVNVTLPNGATQQTTQAAFDQAAGFGGQPSPAPAQPNPLAAPAPMSAPPNGNALTSGGNPATVGDAAATIRAQLAGAAPPASAAPVPLAPAPQQQPGAAGGLPGFTAPSPQQLDQFKASAAQQQADKAEDANYASDVVPIKNVLSLLPEVPLFGQGAEIPNDVAKVLATYGVPAAALQSKDSSEIGKYLAGIAATSGAAPSAVAQLEQAIAANPNMSSDRLAAKDVLGTQLALKRLKHLRVATFGDPSLQNQYSDLASKWTGQQDVRALAFDYLDDPAKAALRKQIETSQAAFQASNPAPGAIGPAQKFVNTYNAAKAAGIFDQ